MDKKTMVMKMRKTTYSKNNHQRVKKEVKTRKNHHQSMLIMTSLPIFWNKIHTMKKKQRNILEVVTLVKRDLEVKEVVVIKEAKVELENSREEKDKEQNEVDSQY